MKNQIKANINGKTTTLTTIILFILLLSSAIILVPTQAATATLPSAIISCTSANGAATFSLPSVGGMTSLRITAVHIEQGTTTLDKPMDTLVLQLISTAAKSPYYGEASIRTSSATTDDYLEWNKQAYNGTSLYTEINGNVTINNLLSVTDNELKVQQNGTYLTVDFNPTTPVAIALNPAIFPPANFSTTWSLPAFHMEFNGYGNATLGNSSLAVAAGWIKTDNFLSYSANATFNCPSWNNFTVVGTGATVKTFNYRVDKNPSSTPAPIPSNPSYTIDAYTAYTTLLVNIPNVGNITRMSITAGHIDQGTMGPSDFMTLALIANGVSGSAQARITTNTTPEELLRLKRIQNGSSVYTEVNGAATINNIFQLSANELKVQRNGTHLTVDYNPINPTTITLPSQFPAGNFSATWTLPAFHIDLDGYGSLLVANTSSTTTSGYFTTGNYVAYGANATFNCQSWNNYTTAGTNAAVVPYMIGTTKAPAVTEPTPTPTPTPTIAPTTQPTQTATPTSAPTQAPSPQPTTEPSATPTTTESPAPTNTPDNPQFTLADVAPYAIGAVVIIVIIAVLAVYLGKKPK